MKLNIKKLEELTGIKKDALRTVLCRPEFNKYYSKIKVKAHGQASDTYEYSEEFKRKLLAVLKNKADKQLYYRYLNNIKEAGN